VDLILDSKCLLQIVKKVDAILHTNMQIIPGIDDRPFNFKQGKFITPIKE
jgi:hypothetical protein